MRYWYDYFFYKGGNYNDPEFSWRGQYHRSIRRRNLLIWLIVIGLTIWGLHNIIEFEVREGISREESTRILWNGGKHGADNGKWEFIETIKEKEMCGRNERLKLTQSFKCQNCNAVLLMPKDGYCSVNGMTVNYKSELAEYNKTFKR